MVVAWMVVWISLFSGASGHSECVLTKEQAVHKAAKANARQFGLHHMAKPCVVQPPQKKK